MRVSVIIPAYNCEAYAGEAVGSALAQTYRDVEVIVVDDGSTDDTPDVLAAISDPRLHVIRQPNRGISAARNAGLDAATGAYIAFLDADDRWLPTKLERQLRLMEAEPDVVACFTDFTRFNRERVFPDTQFAFFPELDEAPSRPTVEGHVFEGDAYSLLIAWDEFPTWVQTTVVRASVVSDLRFVDAQDETGAMIFAEDGLYCFQAFRRGSVAYIADPLVEVRRHEANVTKRVRDLTARAVEHAKVRVGMLDRLLAGELTPHQRAATKRRLRLAHRGLALAHRDMGDLIGAVRAYGRALVA